MRPDPRAAFRTAAMRAAAVLLSLVIPCLVPLPEVPSLLLHGTAASAAEAPGAVVDQASYLAWLSASGRSTASRYRAYPASYTAYRGFALLVYGTPASVPGNAYDAASGQYRYLGWSYDERPYTNTFYPPDAPSGSPQSSPRNWTGPWQEIPLGTDAAVSWMRLTAREKEHVKAAVLYYSGSSYGGMTFAALGLDETRAIVLSPPSWTLGFALFTQHHWRSTSNLRYATFTGRGIGTAAVACSIAETARPADGVYRIAADAEAVRIPIRVTASVASYGGLARPSDVARLGASAGTASVEGAGAAARTADGWFEVTRDQLGGAASADVTLTGSAWAVSVMGDRSFGASGIRVAVADEARAEDPFVSVTIVGSIGYFRGQTDLLGRAVAYDPMRFLGLETVTVTARFRTPPGRVLFSPCAELRASSFDDPAGNRYRLGDFLGRTPLFPRDFTVVPAAGATVVSFRYVLPLAPSTVSWEGARLRDPYSFTVRAEKGGRSFTRTVGGIGITGDVFDVLHLQPA